MRQSKPARAVLPTLDPERVNRRFEWIVFVHTSALVVFISWAFGGATGWARETIGWAGCGGLLILIAALLSPQARQGISRPALLWMLPFAGLVALVAASAFNPSFAPRQFGETTVYVAREHARFWPSSARPDLLWPELLMYAGCFFAAMNIAVFVHRRRVIRWLLLVIALNAFALSIMGTAQKLLGESIYFGAVQSPNLFWFATFVYHNHWGAFIVLSLGAVTALVSHQLRHIGATWELWRTPALSGVVAALFIAATLPLSGSRSSSLLAAVLLVVVTARWLLRLIANRRRHGEASGWLVGGVLAATVLAAVAIYQLGRDMITTRLETTLNQVQTMREQGSIGERAALYHDTWRMAQDRWWTGWGLESFGTVFSNYDSQESYRRHPPTHYEDAHSDWLQSLAEVGVIGTALLLLTGILPLIAVFRHGTNGELTFPLWLSCGLLLLYACIEFPLANPAVVFVFWLLFFSAVRYTLLTTSSKER